VVVGRASPTVACDRWGGPPVRNWLTPSTTSGTASMHPRELMGYLGLVPSESSTGDTVNRGGITKAGNGRAFLVEAAWSYRYPPRVSREKQIKVTAAPRVVREIAWKAQMGLPKQFMPPELSTRARRLPASGRSPRLSPAMRAAGRAAPERRALLFTFRDEIRREPLTWR
jgi:hypothetical protein